MKKLAFLLALFVALVAPVTGLADDIQNPDECKANGDGVFIQNIPINNGDRGSGCVNFGDTQVVYIGGELQGEQEWHNGGPCGAVVVMDEMVTPEGQFDFDHEDCD